MIRYTVTSGHPDTGRACTVTAEEDGETIAYYTGFFSTRRRLWTLYICLNEARRTLPGKLILGEREVGYDVKPAILPRKQAIQKKPEPERGKIGTQLKLK